MAMTSLQQSPPLRSSPSAKVLAGWQSVLIGGVEDASDIIAAAQRRVPDLAAEVAVQSRADRWMLERGYLPGAALYLELRSRYGQDRALALVRACFTADDERSARPWRLLDRTPWFFPIFRWSFKLMSSRFYARPAWDLRWIEDSPQRLRFDVTRCFALDTFTALGIPELTAVVCLTDVVMSANARHLEFVRTGTLAQGCEVCDFCYERRDGGRPGDDPKHAGA
jgi:hypothetical protein